MSALRNRSFIRLGIFAGVILLGILIGYVTGYQALVFDILGAIGLVLVGITILVTIHELGHFLTAKAFGMRVETFSIGFPPKIFSFQKGDTEYQIGATPLGGYVKISGIIDESLDTEHINEAPKPYEFRAKPVWQRLIVMTGGVIMNVILGVFIFSMMKWQFGEERLPMSEVKYGIEVNEPWYEKSEDGKDSVKKQSLGYFLGFRTGDELVSFKGQQLPYFNDYINQQNLLEDDAYYEVKRGGELVKISIPGYVQNYFNSDTISSVNDFIYPAIPPIISVTDSMNISTDETKKEILASPAFAAGLRSGDMILKLDSTDVRLFSEITRYVKGKKNHPISVVAERDGEVLTFLVTTTAKGLLGVSRAPIDSVFQSEVKTFGFFGAFIPGTRDAFTFLSANVKGIRNFSKEGVEPGKSIMGPFQIAYVYLQAFKNGGVKAFLTLTGMLSMVLAFVNILPIPALDGGHVVFLLIEAITRKEPSAKIRIISQQIGMVLILSLMLLIIFNDIFRLAV
ncbi:MAG: RIP metalloprotease RseP [Bacteroidia bacterium]|nr:RIP metalloprotease RseP [Bacteroidia bacterium]